MKKLIKIDRNGSKHYEGLVTCDRCGGLGLFITHVLNGQPVPTTVDHGICHKCGGSGKVEGKWIERTPEYQAKLDAKRQAKREAQAAAQAQTNSQKWLAENGFNAEGQTWILLGDTYARREEIKAAGGKYDGILGWHIGHQVDEAFMISVDDLAERNDWGWYSWKVNKADVEKLKKEHEGAPVSKHQGTVGQRITIRAKYARSFSFDSYFGTVNVHKFTDEAGNIYTWKTQSGLDLDPGSQVELTGTVKAHSEYKGEKQTELSRCKIK